MIQPRIYDESGVHGAPGSSGEDPDDPMAPLGQDGQKGGHGTRGQPGKHGSNIQVRLSTPTTTANIPKNVVLPNPIDVDVKLVYTAGRTEKLDNTLKIDSGESMSFLAMGGNGGNGGNGSKGQNGGKGKEYGAFLVLPFNESISEYAWRTVDWMQLNTNPVLMEILVATEELAVTQVKAVMVEMEEPFKSLFLKPTLISLCSLVPPNVPAEGGVQQGNQGSEVSLFRVILPRPLSEMIFSIRHWRKGWGRRLAIHAYNNGCNKTRRWFNRANKS
jgi:hypothetical protein